MEERKPKENGMEDSPLPDRSGAVADPSAAPPRRRRAISVLAILLLLAATAAAWFWLGRPTGPTAGAPPPSPPQVTVAKPVVKNIVEWDDFTGRFEATDDVAVRSRVTGYLDQIHFKDGAIIKKGDLLFTIDPRSFQAAADEASARLDNAKTALNLASQELQRAEGLRTGVEISQSVLDQRRQQFLSAQAEVQGATAALQQARLNLDYTKITAPISGRISNRRLSVGNLVNANDTILTTVVALNPIYFYFDVDERSYIAYARMALQGERPSGRDNAYEVRMVVPGDPKESRIGHINFVDNRIDSATGTMRGRAIFDNPDLFLQPGMFGRISIPGSGDHQAVLIPDEAIGSDQDRRIVYVVGPDNKISTKAIRPGPKIDGYRVVRRGLSGDETIVVDGIVRARPGATVTPEPTTLPPVAASLAQ
jgi:RND family efflux transporter MFP subunit